jgi:hypothetical protein
MEQNSINLLKLKMEVRGNFADCDTSLPGAT